MNMAEVTLNLDFDIKTGPLNWKVITRFDKECKPTILDDLEERMELRLQHLVFKVTIVVQGSHQQR